jgi:hypothetical protein
MEQNNKVFIMGGEEQKDKDDDRPESTEFMDNDSISDLNEIRNSLVISDCGSIKGSVRLSDRVAVM